jgi:phage shock protein PspC (stress-responsive transcriptional regulator)
MKKLYRSNTDRKLCGVCGGLAEHFDIDPTIIRLIFIFLTLFGGGGLLIYLICALVIPKSPIL